MNPNPELDPYLAFSSQALPVAVCGRCAADAWQVHKEIPRPAPCHRSKYGSVCATHLRQAANAESRYRKMYNRGYRSYAKKVPLPPTTASYLPCTICRSWFDISTARRKLCAVDDPDTGRTVICRFCYPWWTYGATMQYYPGAERRVPRTKNKFKVNQYDEYK